MNNIVASFDQILKFAKSYGIADTKKRGILREYLQVKILQLIYQEKVSQKLMFVGGTSLRLLRNLPRFSEDMDFDLVGVAKREVAALMEGVKQRLVQEGIAVELYQNQAGKRNYYELRFKDLLYQLQISSQVEEKLMIKFDFESFWQGQGQEVVLLERYGFLAKVVTLPLDQILVQKLTAYTKRRRTLPRDMYDVVWLYAQGGRWDGGFAGKNNLGEEVILKAQEKFEREKSGLSGWKRKLRPFLIEESEVDKLDLLPEVLTKLK